MNEVLLKVEIAAGRAGGRRHSAVAVRREAPSPRARSTNVVRSTQSDPRAGQIRLSSCVTPAGSPVCERRNRAPCGRDGGCCTGRRLLPGGRSRPLRVDDSRRGRHPRALGAALRPTLHALLVDSVAGSARRRHRVRVRGVQSQSQIELDVWLDHWLPGLEQDGLLVGINWSGSGATGYDIAPADMLRNVTTRMRLGA